MDEEELQLVSSYSIIYGVTICFLCMSLLFYFVRKLLSEHKPLASGGIDQPILQRQERADDGQEVDGPLASTENGRPLTRRDLARAQKKAEKKERKEHELRVREERTKALKEKDERERQRIDEKEAEHKKKEEEERSRIEEARKRDQEEYAKWKKQMVISDEGEKQGLEDRNLLETFLNHIKYSKIIKIDELAGLFGLKQTDVVARLEDLEKNGMILGVFDERGRYIFITEEEVNSLVQYVHGKGRIRPSSDFTEACNRLIRLKPLEQDLILLASQAQTNFRDLLEDVGDTT